MKCIAVAYSCHIVALSSTSADSMSQPAHSTAAVGAGLLNNARLKQRRSSATDTAPAAGRGKLKRPSVMVESIRKEKANRGDLFEIQASPAKRDLESPGTAGRAHEELQGAQVNASPPSLPVEETRTGLGEDLSPIASQRLSHSTHQISKPANQRPKKKAPVAKEHNDQGGITIEQLHAGQSRPSAGNASQSRQTRVPMRRKSQIEVRVPVCRSSKQQPPVGNGGRQSPLVDGPDETEDNPQRESPKTNPLVCYNHESKKRKVSHIHEFCSQDQSSNPSSPAQLASDKDETNKELSGETEAEEKSTDEDETNKQSSDEGEAEDKSPDAVGDVETARVPKLGSIDAVFAFLDQNGRSGKCHTDMGTTIGQMCKHGGSALKDAISAHEHVMSMTDEIRKAIREINSVVQEEDRVAFKGDAYMYLFRALTQYLKVLFDWLCARADEVTESLEAMRILVPYMRDLLGMRRSISQWPVPVPQLLKGERIIRDLTSDLIVPLCEVYNTYSKKLRQLENSEERRCARERQRQQLREAAEEEQSQLEATVSRQEKQKRWQELQIARMLCEPDPVRRRQLDITLLEHLEERDANGLPFERVPVFGPRSSPLIHRAEEKAWTDEETTALLDGVQRFSGMLIRDSSHPVFELTLYRSATL